LSINAILHNDNDDMKFDGIDDNDMITMWSLIGLMMKMWRQCNGDVKFDGIDDEDMKMMWILMELMMET